MNAKEITKNQIIDTFVYAVGNIDFEKINAFMLLTNWKWSDGKVPTIDELKNHVHILFDKYIAYKTDFDMKKSTHIASGGFYINYWVWEYSFEIEIGFTVDKFTTSI